jgi:hypothetical protein
VGLGLHIFEASWWHLGVDYVGLLYTLVASKVTSSF